MIALLGAATDALTAQQIMSRWAAVSGVTEQDSRTSVQRFEYTNYGRTLYVTVTSEAPNKVLIRSEFPWRHLVTYLGYDGKTGWTATNFGAGAPAGPETQKLALTQAAWYNDADILRGRADVQTERLPDVTVNGKSYYAIKRTTTGGASDTTLIDKQTFYQAGFTSRPGRYDMCISFLRESGVLECKEETITEDGKVVGKVLRMDVPANEQVVNEAQFAPPTIPADDGTTDSLLQKYADAIGPTMLGAPYSLVGEERITYDNRPGVFWAYQWRLDVRPPMQYSLTTISRGGRKYQAVFDGTTGYIKSPDGATTDRTFIMSIRGPLLAQCAAQPSACGLEVRHLPNVKVSGTSYAALGVWSARDPAVHYILLLDPATWLPFAANVYDSTAYFANYLRSPAGLTYPTEIRQEDLWDEDDVRNIEPASGS